MCVDETYRLEAVMAVESEAILETLPEELNDLVRE